MSKPLTKEMAARIRRGLTKYSASQSELDAINAITDGDMVVVNPAALAREVCKIAGRNPDEVIGNGHGDCWPLHSEVEAKIRQFAAAQGGDTDE